MQKSVHVRECSACLTHGEDEALHRSLGCIRRWGIEQMIKVDLGPA
jgi:hypothetical protein